MPKAKCKMKVKAATRRPLPQRKPAPQRAIVKAQAPTIAEAIEKVLIAGDLSPLSVEQRLEYYKAVCRSLGLNPLTRPFDYIAFRETDDSPAKLVLYARRDCGDQLRKIHGVAVLTCKSEMDNEFVTAEVTVQDKTGRTDTGLGVVPLTGWSKKRNESYRLKGRELANARMKAETKAKRRATLSICGLGILDESELDGIENIRYLSPGGRVIEPAKERDEFWCNKHNCDISKCPSDGHTQAENDSMLRMEQQRKLTTGQREILNAKMADTTINRPTDCLFYVEVPESGTYTIDGSVELKRKYWKMPGSDEPFLQTLWEPTAGALVAKTPQVLGKLISQMEKLKVKFIPWPPPREPGE